jgi:hypothetical protein
MCLTDVDKLNLFLKIFCSIVDLPSGKDIAKEEKVATAEAVEDPKEEAKLPATNPEGPGRSKKWNSC